jgi:diketogulonate reductase-like aldo/keto reductase
LTAKKPYITLFSRGARHEKAIQQIPAYYNEAEVGEAVKTCGIPREELFLTTKIWISNGGYDKARASIDESLRRLKTDYIDARVIIGLS